MAQLRSPSGRTNELTVDQLLHGNDSTCQSPTSPMLGKNYDQEEDHDQQNKKSVLAKVKEKARKFRNTLVKKKNGNDDNATPEWGVSFEDDYDDEDEEPEYYGAPMYESELAPEDCKEMARQHPRADPVISENHVLASSIPKEQEHREDKPSKTITESVTEKLAPAYAMASETTHMIASKIQDMAIATSVALATRDKTSSNEDNKWDRGTGTSMKEYLIQKLEPGEEERALSQVISEAISPKEALGDIGVVEKVKGAVSSLLGMEEESKKPIPKNMSTEIPVSTNAYEVVEEENEGRILQAN